MKPTRFEATIVRETGGIWVGWWTLNLPHVSVYPERWGSEAYARISLRDHLRWWRERRKAETK